MWNGAYFFDTDGGRYPNSKASNVCKFLGMGKMASQSESQPKDSFRPSLTSSLLYEGRCNETPCTHAGVVQNYKKCTKVKRNGITFCKVDLYNPQSTPAWNKIRCGLPCSTMENGCFGFNANFVSSAYCSSGKDAWTCTKDCCACDYALDRFNSGNCRTWAGY